VVRKLPVAGLPSSEGYVCSMNIGRGLPKRAAERGGALVTRLGVVGDAQNEPLIKPWGGHGGEKKAVMLWSLDVMNAIAREGHPNVQPGRCGEQITLCGIEWALLKTGARVQLGERVLLEVTLLKAPCDSQEVNFTQGVGDGIHRISADRYPDDSRVLARVLRGGFVATGDKVRVWRSPRALSGVVVRCKSDPGNFISEEYLNES
jgi:MOSC domain-containing protein YiiM